MRPIIRRVVVATAVIAVLAVHHFSDSTLQRSPTAATTSAAPTPPDLLHLGRLTLQPCVIGDHAAADGAVSVSAYCTRVSVPENWDAPTGRRIDLKVAIVKASTQTAAADLLTFLDGGPGGAATNDYPLMAGALDRLRQQRSMLLIDQRGTGGSNALSCPTKPALASAEDPTIQLMMLRQCLMALQTRADIAHYTTTDAVRDLEAVRQALGAPELNLIGVSYGTRVAQQYARRYPSAVRTVVLDGPVPNRLALASEHARSLEAALRSLLGRCRTEKACAQRFTDPYATLYRVRDALRAHPQTVELHDPVSFAPLRLTLTADDLAAVVRFYAYNPTSAALLPLMLQEADHGNYAPLLGQRRLLADDLADRITGGMELSVLCTEDVDLLTPSTPDEQTLLGNRLITQARAACDVWPHGQRPADFHAPWISSIPTLVLAGEFDPVTPPAYGSEIVHGLSRARLLVAPGQGHGVMGAGCMPQLLQRFIEITNAALIDARCLQRLGAARAFIDYNGSAP